MVHHAEALLSWILCHSLLAVADDPMGFVTSFDSTAAEGSQSCTAPVGKTFLAAVPRNSSPLHLAKCLQDQSPTVRT